ncbi:class I SAM-dependent methyltransferase [Kribbella sp. CA-294648]|uniref:class I SAM-dependent methyltransferase n=1 Tax=Kribbella sp. CA-294648 TaxID=3239948 RepID=UPI003D8FC928
MCPARLILLPPGSRDRLSGERVAAVYATRDAEALATQLAEELGVRLTLLPEHGEAEEVVRGIADEHRGETVVVIAPGLELGIALPAVIEHEGDGWTVEPSPKAYLIELFDLIDAHLRSGGDVLELGTGQEAAELERRGHRVRRTDALTDDFGGPYDLVFADAVFLDLTPEQLATVFRNAHASARLLAFTTNKGDEGDTQYRDLLEQCGWTVLAWQHGQATPGGWYYVLARRT